MNVTFHALGSFATAAVLSLKPGEKYFSASSLAKYVIGFIAGILIHGLLDYAPHEYPIYSKVDPPLALFLLALTLFAAQKQNYLLILICFAGCIFPDIVDLGPVIVKKYLGISAPQLPFRLFPWHLKEFSGSIYDGSRRAESTFYHLAFVILCVALLYVYRKKFFRFKFL